MEVFSARARENPALTAEDVIYSLDRIRKPPRGIVSPRKGLLGNIASIEAGGPLTVSG